MQRSTKVSFKGHDGSELAARLEMPAGRPRAYALFAHCFSCSKDILAATRIARHLTENDIAVLRFDFTGRGGSEGDFANTNFTSNVQDLVAAAEWLRAEHGAADLLIGHSLGGAASIVAATKLPFVKAVATIGAPSEAGHVLRQMPGVMEAIDEKGEADVLLADRPFKIKRQFVEDVKGSEVREAAAKLKRPLIILHSPVDEIVSIENATGLFISAKHPKSFVSLDHADHLLTNPVDTEYAADVIAAWADRYISEPVAIQPPAHPSSHDTVIVSETGEGGYANHVVTEHHLMRADEPENLGGLDTGPAPYEFISAGLGACTSITLRMYLNRKNWPVDHIRVNVTHSKEDPENGSDRQKDVFTRELQVTGDLSEDQRSRLVEIANKCPVHKTLHNASEIRTHLTDIS